MGVGDARASNSNAANNPTPVAQQPPPPKPFQKSYSKYLGCVGGKWAAFWSGSLTPSTGNPEANLGKANLFFLMGAALSKSFGATASWLLAADVATFSAASSIRTECTQQFWNPNYGK